MPESGIFSSWALSAAYTSASTAWSDRCQEACPWLPVDARVDLPVLWWKPLYSYSVQGFTVAFRIQSFGTGTDVSRLLTFIAVLRSASSWDRRAVQGVQAQRFYTLFVSYHH